eukprot:TRINITY_DN3859_c2_g1_i1.p1 TRINITY_DN3859_c2_g1~~TRINITY_DN3859_c2_g1_i1.p1  ORF type:complete len:745 (+),score=199.01 TRINITY_DN3859_c2_g1_i1:58-2292(+)
MAGNANSVAVPEELKCIITHELMEDAVVDPDGNSYSEWAIHEWLARNGTSPVTRRPLTTGELVPNRMVRDLVEKFRQEHNMGAAKTKKKPVVDGPEPAVPTLGLRLTRSGNKLLCSVTPATSVPRLPTHIVAIIDTSGSMASQASVQNEKGQRESHGLSQLDLVKHSINTIIQCLSDTDKFSLVSYNSVAKVEFEAMLMTKDGKKTAKQKLDALQPSGQTNLWDGLYKGMETIRNAKQHGLYNENIMLFTDGMPNVIPPRGHLPMLKKYIDEFGLVASINTFGFGYSLDSKLLHELAVEGMGAYGFIPDSSLVGTVFVNAISNQLAKCCRNAVLNIEETGSCKLAKAPVQGGYEHTRTSWGVQIRLGDLVYGQPKDVIVCFDSELDTYELPDVNCITGINLKDGTQASGVAAEEVHDMKALEVNNLRTLFVDTVKHGLTLGLARNLVAAREGLQKLDKVITESNLASEQVKDLQTDLTGQVMEAFDDRYFDKWGRHFLPSLLTAHLHQMCNNFKDPGVQHYGGGLFKKLRDKADDIFLKLPPPTPSKPARSGYAGFGYNATSTTAAAPVAMNHYYNRSGGCIAGDGLVSTPEGYKRADKLRKGDLVSTAFGDAEVLCVVRMTPKGGKIDMVAFEEGLKITPFHPILRRGTWEFPGETRETTTCKAEYVYDYVLSNGHTVTVNGITCVTLGHDFTAPIVAHPYFGSNRVVRDLESLESYHTGVVTLSPECFVRDPSGYVIGLEVH